MKLGTKQSLKSGFKKGAAIAGALAVGALGVKGVKQEVGHQQSINKADNKATLAGIASQQSPLKGQGTATGTDSQGNIYGTGGITAGSGVVLGRSAPPARNLSKRLDPSQLTPFDVKKAGIKAVAGVVGGKTGVGGAVKNLAGSAYEGMGGGATADPRASYDRGARAGSSVVVGAEGVKASNRELLRQGANKVKGKLPRRRG